MPFVDKELFQLTNPLDIEYETNHYTQNKHLLKNIAEKYLPKELIYQQKIGFPMPIREWFMQDEARIFGIY